MGLGANFRQQRPYPNSNLFDYMIKSVDICDSHACAVDTQGRLFVWGTGKHGELGLDSTQQVLTPTIVTKQKQINVKKAIVKKNFTAFCSGAGYLYIFGQLSEYVALGENGLLRSSLRASRKFGTQQDLNTLRQSRQNNPLSKSNTRPLSSMIQIMSVSENYIVDISAGKNFLVALSQNGEAYLIDETLQSVEINSNPLQQVLVSGSKILGLNRTTLYVWNSQGLGKGDSERVLLRQNFPMQVLKLSIGYQSCPSLMPSASSRGKAALVFQAPFYDFDSSVQSKRVAEYVETQFKSSPGTTDESEVSADTSQIIVQTELQGAQTQAKVRSGQKHHELSLVKKLDEQFDDGKSEQVSEQTAVIDDSDKIIDSQAAVVIQPLKPVHQGNTDSQFSFKNPQFDTKTQLQNLFGGPKPCDEDFQVIRESQNHFQAGGEERLSTIRDNESLMSVSQIHFIGESTGKKSIGKIERIQLLKESEEVTRSIEEKKELQCSSFQVIPQKEVKQKSQARVEGDMSRQVPEVTVPSFLQFSSSKLSLRDSAFQNQALPETEQTVNTIFSQVQRRQSEQQEVALKNRYESQDDDDSNYAEEVEISVKFANQPETEGQRTEGCFGLIPGLEEVKLSITATPSKLHSIQESNLMVSASSQRSQSFVRKDEKSLAQIVKSPMSQNQSLPLQVVLKSNSKQSILSGGFDLSITKSQVSPQGAQVFQSNEILSQKQQQLEESKSKQEKRKAFLAQVLTARASKDKKEAREPSPASKASQHSVSKNEVQEFPFNTLPLKATEEKDSFQQVQMVTRQDLSAYSKSQVTPDSQAVIRKINFDESTGAADLGQNQRSRGQQPSCLLNFTITSKQSSNMRQDSASSKKGLFECAKVSLIAKTQSVLEDDFNSTGAKPIYDSESPLPQVKPFTEERQQFKDSELFLPMPFKAPKGRELFETLEKRLQKLAFVKLFDYASLLQQKDKFDDFSRKNLPLMLTIRKKTEQSMNDVSTLSNMKQVSQQAIVCILERALNREIKALKHQGLKRIKKVYKEAQLELYIQRKQQQFAQQTQILTQIDMFILQKQKQFFSEAFQGLKAHNAEIKKQEAERAEKSALVLSRSINKVLMRQKENVVRKIQIWSSEKKLFAFKLKMFCKALSKARAHQQRRVIGQVAEFAVQKHRLQASLDSIIKAYEQKLKQEAFDVMITDYAVEKQETTCFERLDSILLRQLESQAFAKFQMNRQTLRKTEAIEKLTSMLAERQTRAMSRKVQVWKQFVVYQKNQLRMKQTTVKLLVSKVNEVLRGKHAKLLAIALKQIEFNSKTVGNQQLFQQNLSFDKRMETHTIDARGFHTQRGRNQTTYLPSSDVKDGARKSSRKPKLNDYLSFSPRGGDFLPNKFTQRRGTEANYSEKTTIAKVGSSSTHKGRDLTEQTQKGDFCHASIKELNNAFKTQISKIKHWAAEGSSSIARDELQSPGQEMEQLLGLPSKSPTANPLCTSDFEKRPLEEVTNRGVLQRAKWKRDPDENVYGSQEGRLGGQVRELRPTRVSTAAKIYAQQSSSVSTARKQEPLMHPTGKENILVEGADNLTTQRVKSFNSQQTEQANIQMKQHQNSASPFHAYMRTENEQTAHNSQDKEIISVTRDQLQKFGDFVPEDQECEMRSRVTNPQRDSIFSTGQQYAEPMEMDMCSPKTETISQQDALRHQLLQSYAESSESQQAQLMRKSSDDSLVIGNGTVIEKMSLEMLQKTYFEQQMSVQTCEVHDQASSEQPSEDEPYNLQLSSNTKFRVLPGQNGEQPLLQSSGASANVSDFSADKPLEPNSQDVCKKLSYDSDKQQQNVNVKPYTSNQAYSKAVPHIQAKRQFENMNGESINFNLTQEESSDESDYAGDTAEREDEIPQETSNIHTQKELPRSQIPLIGFQEALSRDDMMKIAMSRQEKLNNYNQSACENFQSISSQNSHVSPISSFAHPFQGKSLVNSSASYWSNQQSANQVRKPYSRNEPHTQALNSFRNSKISEGSFNSQNTHRAAFQTVKPGTQILGTGMNHNLPVHKKPAALGIRKHSEPGKAQPLNSHRGQSKGLMALSNVLSGQGNMSHRNAGPGQQVSRNGPMQKKSGLASSFSSMRGMAQFLNASSQNN